MSKLAIIGGTGLDSLIQLQSSKRVVVDTPYGAPSGLITRGMLFGEEILFLPRHGYSHSLPPHKINYRANLWALHELGAESVLAIAAVGGIRADMTPARLAIPDQIIDYTWGRTSTFNDAEGDEVVHIDFSQPYCETLRQRLLAAAVASAVDAVDGGTYGVTQGPRLETAAEISRMERDGCHLVGMTAMPEAALARELGLCYASCAVVANWAAGKSEGVITMDEIEANLKVGMEQVGRLLQAVCS
jgi:5'-deoxy-5'-methylthioadenosine phosphorylase